MWNSLLGEFNTYYSCLPFLSLSLFLSFFLSFFLAHCISLTLVWNTPALEDLIIKILNAQCDIFPYQPLGIQNNNKDRTDIHFFLPPLTVIPLTRQNKWTGVFLPTQRQRHEWAFLRRGAGGENNIRTLFFSGMSLHLSLSLSHSHTLSPLRWLPGLLSLPSLRPTPCYSAS